MRLVFAWMLVGSLLLAGCGDDAADQAANPSADISRTAPNNKQAMPKGDPAPNDLALPEESTPSEGEAMTADAGGAAVPTEMPVPAGFTAVRVDAGVVTLSPDNSTVQFVGKHTEGGVNDPRARTGVFERFTGRLEIDPATRTIKSASAEIDAMSLYTPIGNLTNHLKSPEFLDVELHPTIKFVSRRITPARETGVVNIVGDLTLHGVTKEITLPAKISLNDAGVTIQSQLTINRREFGINHMNIDNRVLPTVELTLAVGKRTERPQGGR